ncbi:hypothetical protein OG21DRAFT_1370440, partial [Imleria badia]
ELIRDVKSRWDSIYLMINHLHILQQPLDYFFMAPAHRDIADYALTEMHWLVLEDLETVLEASIPDSFLPLLSCTIPLFEAVIMAWEHLKSNAPRCA